eukprot:m.307174 g.307174  ORF g.307174 m.307174 type:complete len:61 (-) comp20191_c1_seq81:3724-3906(-)
MVRQSTATQTQNTLHPNGATRQTRPRYSPHDIEALIAMPHNLFQSTCWSITAQLGTLQHP